MEISLEEIVKQADDLDWLDERINDIIRQLASNLKKENSSTQATIILLSLFPHIIHSEHIKKWSNLIDQAIRHVVDSPVANYPETFEPEYLIEGHYLIKRLDHRSPVQMAEPKRRSRTRINPRRFFEQYLLLTMTLFFRGELTLTEQHIDNILLLARQVNNQSIYNKAYQVVALIFHTLKEYEQAERFALISLKSYEQQQNRLECAISANILAAACRELGQMEDAAFYQQQAQDCVKSTSYENMLGNMFN